MKKLLHIPTATYWAGRVGESDTVETLLGNPIYRKLYMADYVTGSFYFYSKTFWGLMPEEHSKEVKVHEFELVDV